MSSTFSLIAAWVKLEGGGAERVTSVRCDPAITTVDDLKKLVKLEYSNKLECIDTPTSSQRMVMEVC